MNKYIDKTYGVGILFKSGGDLGFVLNEEVDFGMPLGYIQKAWNIRNEFPIQFGDATGEYDPKNKKWKKKDCLPSSTLMLSIIMLISFWSSML